MNLSKIDYYYKKVGEKAAKRLKWGSFFMAYPYFTIVQNVSFFFMIFFYVQASRLPLKLFRVHNLMGLIAVVYMFGAVASTISSGFIMGSVFFDFSIRVLPNYIYWGLLIITLGNSALKLIPLLDFYKIFFYSIIALIVTYFFLASYLKGLPVYRNVTQNNFAFVLIIFSPMATYYVSKHWNNFVYTAIFIAVVTTAGFMSGSRSGSLLTLLGCGMVLALGNWVRLTILGFCSLLLYFLAPTIINSGPVKSTIFRLNERTYDFIYNNEETLATDRSYLTRLAMIEKGLNIFEQYPITGIGLGNFAQMEGEIDFNFEGAEWIENKEEELKKNINPHNSYISFLSEGGLLLFIPAVALWFLPIIYFMFNYNRVTEDERAVFIGLVVMCIHASAIAGMVNVYGWFLLGIANAIMINKRNGENRVPLPQQLHKG
ncbi:MAG: O-antigen ligase family protein [Bacteroidota bacterium]